ncbi:hypothetical protein [Haemophilus influenzae]|uniref:hypothetical protein n=1 Tax=Haemophilus influenzae TaxID=727 RepID=UPI003DA453F7
MGTNLPALFEKINFLGAMVESYTRTLMYRAEIKRIDAQIEQIRLQSEIMHSKLNKAYQIEIEKINTRRAELTALYTTVNNELHNNHLERLELIKLTPILVKELTNAQLSIEEKIMIGDMIKDHSRLIKDIGERSNLSLDKLIDSLPKLEHHKFLIEGK